MSDDPRAADAPRPQGDPSASTAQRSTGALSPNSTPTSSSGGLSPSGSTSVGAQAGFWAEDYTPTRADRICLGLILLSAVYGIAVMLARPTLLGYSPLVLATLSGSRSALVTIGAQHAVGLTSWGVVVAAFLLSTVSAIKLDLLMWWAGRLWGDVFVANLVGDSHRKARSAERAEQLVRRFESLAIVLLNVPVLPIPRGIITAVLGASGTRFRKLLVVDLLASAVVQAMWLVLGHRIGQPVVQVVEVIARYSLWLTLAILAVIVVGAMRKARRDTGDDSDDPAADTTDGVPTVDDATVSASTDVPATSTTVDAPDATDATGSADTTGTDGAIDAAGVTDTDGNTHTPGAPDDRPEAPGPTSTSA
ncbi:VTT domain-containing protein [Mobilicoccus pelagius]|uniref:VTT domain-containing protein n=1 Tax=Mobilicoccus pelagius NBRC 104925 TaxID=1089455 RepID=H5UW58_9MICO|nr:VTT domain-containing protein [Mobilicoccus pelagius]GAB49966.1 hypothetical protein MOPEL_135_02040 [Mobilicoccus pelagius NBRC 104925]